MKPRFRDAQVVYFARDLEEAGFKGALLFLKENIVPKALEQGIDLITAAWQYADPKKDPNTAHYQLYSALIKLEKPQGGCGLY